MKWIRFHSFVSFEQFFFPFFLYISIFSFFHNEWLSPTTVSQSHHQIIIFDQSNDHFNFHLCETIKISIKMKFHHLWICYFFLSTFLFLLLCRLSSFFHFFNEYMNSCESNDSTANMIIIKKYIPRLNFFAFCTSISQQTLFRFTRIF